MNTEYLLNSSAPLISEIHKMLDQVLHVASHIANHPSRPGGVFGESTVICLCENAKYTLT